jgi:hypothetical protein
MVDLLAVLFNVLGDALRVITGSVLRHERNAAS